MENKDINDVLSDRLINFSETELDKKNPYKSIKLEEVLDNFFGSLEKNDLDFSWVEKLNGIGKKNAEDKDKIAMKKED